MLYGNRFTGDEALKRGFVDAAGKDAAETIKLGKELGLKWASKARAGMIMGILKDGVVSFMIGSSGPFTFDLTSSNLLWYQYENAKRELLDNRPGARPTPEQMKRLTENVQKGLLEDAKKAKARM